MKDKLIRFFKSFQKDFLIGLDIGSSSVKLAQFVKREEGLVLLKVDLKETAPHGDLSSALRELVRGVNLKKTKVFVSLNSPKTCLRAVLAPPMPERELKEAVALESKNYFPFSIEDAILDYETVGRAVEKGQEKIRLAVAVSPRKTVEDTLALLKNLGMRPIGVLPAPSALQKLAAASHPKEDETRCWLDVGAGQSELVILKGRQLVFSRKIPVAGGDFTQAMTKVLATERGRMELKLEEAEQIKREVGIPAEGESRLIQDKISTTQMFSMLRSPLEELVSEIDRCFDYYREETGGQRIDSLELFGRGASLKGLDQALSQGLGIEVKIGDPLKGLPHQAQMVRPEGGFAQFAAAIGAALSLGHGINLLPPEIKEEIQRALKRATIQSAVASAVLLLAFFYIGMRIQLGNFEKRATLAEIELEYLKTEHEKAARQRLTEEILAREPYWEEVFKEISNLIPKEIYLTELSFENHRLHLKGVVVAVEREKVLSDFMLSLEKGIFKNVKLVTTREREDKSAETFELECRTD